MKRDADKNVHELRLAVKRLRALVRLLAPLGLEGADRLNKDLRAVGRKLSPARDSVVRAKWLAKRGFRPPSAARAAQPRTASAARRLATLHRELLARMPAR